MAIIYSTRAYLHFLTGFEYDIAVSNDLSLPNTEQYIGVYFSGIISQI